MHGYIKINDGPFLFCEGTHQSVLGPLLLLLDHGKIVSQGTKGDLVFIGTQAKFFPWFILLFNFHRTKMLAKLLNPCFTSFASCVSWCNRMKEASYHERYSSSMSFLDRPMHALIFNYIHNFVETFLGFVYNTK
jgi:hypothetical protein